MTQVLQTSLLVLQSFQVAFLWLHDWVPLGRLNDVSKVRRQDSLGRLLVVTLIQSVPFTLGLWWSAQHFGQPFSQWPLSWLWVSYGILFVGQLRAWWLPYLFRPEPARAARYQAMFGRTHAFLPVRHGLVPNTAHVLLHLATLTTLGLLGIVWLRGQSMGKMVAPSVTLVVGRNAHSKSRPARADRQSNANSHFTSVAV